MLESSSEHSLYDSNHMDVTVLLFGHFGCLIASNSNFVCWRNSILEVLVEAFVICLVLGWLDDCYRKCLVTRCWFRCWGFARRLRWGTWYDEQMIVLHHIHRRCFEHWRHEFVLSFHGSCFSFGCWQLRELGFAETIQNRLIGSLLQIISKIKIWRFVCHLLGLELRLFRHQKFLFLQPQKIL